MRAVIVMFDTLNRNFLEPYGCDWASAPKFIRLGLQTDNVEKNE